MTALQVSAQQQLKQFVEQLERLDEEKAALMADIRDKYLEAKGIGFEPKILRKIIARRKKAKAQVEEEEALMDTYLHALEGRALQDAEEETV